MYGAGEWDDSYVGTVIGGGNIQIHQQGGGKNPKNIKKESTCLSLSLEVEGIGVL